MANEYLTRKPTSTGNSKVFTFSGWVKRANTNVRSNIFSTNPGGVQAVVFDLQYLSSGELILENYNNGYQLYYLTRGIYRDPGSWAHVVLSVNTTLDDPQKRARIFVNGIEPKLDYSVEVALNQELLVNSPSYFHEIGKRLYNGSSGQHWDGEMADLFFIDGQALTPDVFGFYKEGKGYISAGSTQATDFRPGQWVPKTPRVIKSEINRRGGFGVNGFYLPMNDSTNFGADFHTTPDTIITLKGEDLPQPKNGAPTTTDAYVSQLRTDPYAANLVLAVPGITGAPGAAHTDFSANIKGSGTNKVVTANGNAGVAVTASYYGSALSFDGTGDYLSIPDNSDFGFGSGDFTIEYWINHNASTSSAHTFDLRSSGDEDSVTVFYTSPGPSTLKVYLDGADKISVTDELKQNQWTHHAIERVGSTLTFYQNGVAVGVNTVSGGTLRSSAPAIVGAKRDATASLNGYMQDFRVYKGVAKYKGGFDVPKPFTPVGIGTWRAVSDCAANNFATLNPLNKDSSNSLSNGNLTVVTSSAGQGFQGSTIGISTGKWYWEIRVDDNSGNTSIGIASPESSSTGYVGSGSTSYGYFASNGNKVNNSSSSAYGSTYTTGDIIGVSLDSSNGTLTYYKNGTSQGTAFSSLSGTFLPAISDISGSSSSTLTANFGQNPTFSGNTTAGTYTDSNGKGLFKYQPPSGFLALCEDNLPTPAIADPGKYFKTVLWDGDGNNGHSITGVGFKPDFVWIKERTSTSSHQIHDSIRGAGNILITNSTVVESYSSTYLYSFESDGFVLGTSGGVNASTDGYVAWCWQAGAGTTSTNTDGSINSVVSVNQDAGFSIVSYTGDGSSGATIGHGLNGKTPAFIIVKNIEAAENWQVGHTYLGWTKRVFLDLSAEEQQPTGAWNDTAPTSSVITLGNGNLANQSSKKHIAYCWAEVEGFSKFGGYVGNGNADGPFVHCGFKPAWVMYKRTDTTGDWAILDSSRQSTNPLDLRLFANNANVDTTGVTSFDFLSNGFKIRDSAASINASGATYIFAAFAESPFTTANAK